MKITPRRIRGGHTLLEVLFAMFLLVTCGFIYAATMPMANTSRAKANLNNIALGLAQKELEAIKTRGYAGSSPEMLAQDRPADGCPKLIVSTTPVSANTYSFTSIDLASLDSPASVLPNGQGFVTIEQADIDLRRVTIEVRWTDRGQARSVKIGSLIANL
jgi:hypothetical protein